MKKSLETLTSNHHLKFVDEENTVTRYDMGSNAEEIFQDCDSVEYFHLIIFTPEGKNMGHITFISEYNEKEEGAVFEVQDHSTAKPIGEIVRDLFETENEVF